jgi:hypothetical protein
MLGEVFVLYYWDGSFNMIPRLAYGGDTLIGKDEALRSSQNGVNQAGGVWFPSKHGICVKHVPVSRKGCGSSGID